MTAIVGVIANPAAGKDIRRLVAEASPVSDSAKIAIIRRAVIGAAEGGADRILLTDDRQALAARAIDRLATSAELVLLDEPALEAGRNSERAAARCRAEGVAAVIVLGGDGTHRDVTKGWIDAPMVALSTGTNNVFPRQHEATTAGQAAGLVASRRVGLAQVSRQAKTIEVSVDDADDLALVDVALVDGRFTASRAVWDPTRLRQIVAAIAEPGTVGLSAIPAAIEPIDRTEPGGVHIECSPDADRRVRAPVAPGLFADVGVEQQRRLAENESVVFDGPGVLSFDGERDVVLRENQAAHVRVRANGPQVIDVDRALAASLSTEER